MNDSPPTDPSKPAAHRNGLFNWRNFGRCLISLAVLATLLAIFYAEENWRGRHDWEKCRQEAEAHGINFDWDKLIPPPVPDDQNFAMTPFLKPLLDMNPRPFSNSPWRDTNGWQHAMDFGKDLLNVYTVRAINSDYPFAPTDLTNVAWKLKHPKPAKNRQTNAASEQPMTRAEAAQFILDDMKQYAPVLDEIREASKRLYSRFNVHYEDKDPAGILLPHLAVVRKLSIMFQIEASSDLALGKTDAAAQDVKEIFYLSRSVRGEVFIISYLVRAAIYGVGEKVIWEGLAEHQWTDSQLQEFVDELRKVNLLDDGRHALENEAGAFHSRWFDLIRSDRHYFWDIASDMRQADAAVALLYYIAPTGWLYQEEVSQQKLLDEEFLPAFSPDGTRVFPEFVDRATLEMQKIIPPQAYRWQGGAEDQNSVPAVAYRAPGALSRLVHHEVTAMFMLPSLQNYARKPPRAQTGVEQALIACALERYRLANGKYPESLNALVPKFLEKIPLDVCNGEPMKYHVAEDGRFVLYSVGWNTKDDGGKVVIMSGKNHVADLNQGDWVWPEY